MSSSTSRTTPRARTRTTRRAPLTATRTLVQGGEGAGIDAASATTGVSFTNLSIRLNGRGAAGATAGARLGGSGGTLARCVVESNYGAGAQLVSAAADNSSLAGGVFYAVEGSSTPVAFWNLAEGFKSIGLVDGTEYTTGHLHLISASNTTINSTTVMLSSGRTSIHGAK